MILSLDEEIKKDKEEQRRKERREAYKHRRTQHYNYSHQDQHRRNYSHKVYHLYKKKNYEDKNSPPQRQRSVIKISNLHYSIDKERLEVNRYKHRQYAVYMAKSKHAEQTGTRWAGQTYSSLYIVNSNSRIFYQIGLVKSAQIIKGNICLGPITQIIANLSKFSSSCQKTSPNH